MMGHVVRDVVITVPPYFGEMERQRTRDAGEIAGLNVIAILDEPVPPKPRNRTSGSLPLCWRIQLCLYR